MPFGEVEDKATAFWGDGFNVHFKRWQEYRSGEISFQELLFLVAVDKLTNERERTPCYASYLTLASYLGTTQKSVKKLACVLIKKGKLISAGKKGDRRPLFVTQDKASILGQRPNKQLLRETARRTDEPFNCHLFVPRELFKL